MKLERLKPDHPIRFAVPDAAGIPAKLLAIYVGEVDTGRCVWIASTLNNTPPQEMHRPRSGQLAQLTPEQAKIIDDEILQGMALVAQVHGTVVSVIEYGEVPANFRHNIPPESLQPGRKYFVNVLGTIKASVHFIA